MVNLMVLGAAQQIASEAEYRLVRIEDELVPLAPSITKELLVPTIVAMVLTVLALLVAAYFRMCSKYQNRIKELEPEENVYTGCQIHRLKQTIIEIENKKVEKMLQDVV